MSDESLNVGPGESVIVIGRKNAVLYSDFEPAGASRGDLHLLDVVDSQQQDILRLVAAAVDRPGSLFESEVTFRSERKHVRVVHQADGRTHIIFSPPRPKPRP